MLGFVCHWWRCYFICVSFFCESQAGSEHRCTTERKWRVDDLRWDVPPEEAFPSSEQRSTSLQLTSFCFCNSFQLCVDIEALYCFSYSQGPTKHFLFGGLAGSSFLIVPQAAMSHPLYNPYGAQRKLGAQQCCICHRLSKKETFKW